MSETKNKPAKLHRYTYIITTLESSPTKSSKIKQIKPILNLTTKNQIIIIINSVDVVVNIIESGQYRDLERTELRCQFCCCG